MPPKTVHLAVDMISGDSGLRITIPAAQRALSTFPQLILHLVGDQQSLVDATAAWTVEDTARIRFIHAPGAIHMGDSPAAVVRDGANTSMARALLELAHGEVAAVVSAGNAGALMILARKHVGMLPEATRPAFCSLFPTESGASLLLDLGANVDCSAEQLLSFGLLGSALYSVLFNVESPRISLLSNGTESTKGNQAVREAASQMAAHSALDYTGFIEANSLHSGGNDVVVCDGFVGNVALKSIEGTAELARTKLRELVASINEAGTSETGLEQILDGFSSLMDPELHNGAFLLGLAGVVVKAHGDSSVDGFVASIGQALRCEEHDMIAKMKLRLALAG